jgi:alpha-tubulin suppressor-like RCC1 family protein
MQAAVVSVHLEYVSSFALLADGSIWRWGAGFSTVPEQFEEIDDVVALADKGGCAVKSDGTAWCWGYNSDGQLGNGSRASSDVPVQVLGLSGVVEVDQGHYYACAVTDAREAWCWGLNYGGRLGDGTTRDASAPVRVALDDVVSISAGNWHTCAITGDGSVHCFGEGYLGVWENGDFAETLLPVRVATLQDVVQVHVVNSGHSRTLAITADGTAWGWGDVSYGMLPLDVPDDRVIPDQSNANRFWVWQPYPLVDP